MWVSKGTLKMNQLPNDFVAYKMSSHYEKIGFWNNAAPPIVSNSTYVNGFMKRIKEWNDSLHSFYSAYRQELENGFIEPCRGNVCSICHLDEIGDSEISYGKYTFPIGYLHYIIAHNIDVPVPFQQFVMESVVPKIVWKSKEKRQEESRQMVTRIMECINDV